MRVESPDGEHYAELSRTEEAAGCHGVGGYHSVTTVVNVFDRAGAKVLTVERALQEVISENHPDEISGTTVDAVRFADDGRSVILSLASGDELVCAL
jgi:hypothetical protein